MRLPSPSGRSIACSAGRGDSGPLPLGEGILALSLWERAAEGRVRVFVQREGVLST